MPMPMRLHAMLSHSSMPRTWRVASFETSTGGLKKLALQFIFPATPVLHHLSEQRLPPSAVIWVQRMCELVGDHIVDKVRRRLHQLTVQHEISLRCEASPPLGHVSNYETGSNNAQAQKWRCRRFYAFWENSVALQPVPMSKQRLSMHKIAVLAHRKDDPITVQANMRRPFRCHYKAILFSKKEVSFTAHILAGRGSRTPPFASKQLALYPATAP